MRLARRDEGPVHSSPWGVLAELLGDRVVVVEAQEMVLPVPQAGEARNLLRMTPARQHEFAIGRTCAREALVRLGVRVDLLRQRPDRTPDWPNGVVGSITHCPGFCAAAVARTTTLAGLGIDAEPVSRDRRLALPRICGPGELSRADAETFAAGTNRTIWRFVAKESSYKSLYPHALPSTSFADVITAFEADGRFTATIERPHRPPLRAIGRCVLAGDFVIAAAIPDVAGQSWAPPRIRA